MGARSSAPVVALDGAGPAQATRQTPDKPPKDVVIDVALLKRKGTATTINGGTHSDTDATHTHSTSVQPHENGNTGNTAGTNVVALREPAVRTGTVRHQWATLADPKAARSSSMGAGVNGSHRRSTDPPVAKVPIRSALKRRSGHAPARSSVSKTGTGSARASVKFTLPNGTGGAGASGTTTRHSVQRRGSQGRRTWSVKQSVRKGQPLLVPNGPNGRLSWVLAGSRNLDELRTQAVEASADASAASQTGVDNDPASIRTGIGTVGDAKEVDRGKGAEAKHAEPNQHFSLYSEDDLQRAAVVQSFCRAFLARKGLRDRLPYSNSDPFQSWPADQTTDVEYSVATSADVAEQRLALRRQRGPVVPESGKLSFVPNAVARRSRTHTMSRPHHRRGRGGSEWSSTLFDTTARVSSFVTRQTRTQTVTLIPLSKAKRPGAVGAAGAGPSSGVGPE